MLLEVAEHSLLDQERGSLKTDEVTPFNMAVHPAGRSVVLGLGSAGIRVLDLQEAASGPPTLAYAEGGSNTPDSCCHGIPVSCSACRMHVHHLTFECLHAESEAQQAALHGIGEPKGLAFSVDGRLIAIGDLHSVHIFEWPGLMRKASIRYLIACTQAMAAQHLFLPTSCQLLQH